VSPAGEEPPAASDSPPLPEAPEDFRVEEIPLYEPSGEGEHTFVWVEKRLRTTEEVARDLARAAGAAARDVGYAGRKDRFAVTRQWLSVPRLDPDAARVLALPGARVLHAARHPHKLRTGQLRGNRFEVRLRGVGEEAAAAAAARLAPLLARGLPNRFGAQRFGRGGRNPEAARRILAEGRVRGDRRRGRFLLSALQAQVFNEVLAARGDAFDRVEAGDIAVVHASGGLFLVEDASREAPRAAAFEISATGPIFGSRTREPQGAAAERERAVLERHGVLLEGRLRLPRGVRLRGGRRALRVRPEEVRLRREEAAGEALCLRFELPAGSYATVLLAELFGEPSRG